MKVNIREIRQTDDLERYFFGWLEAVGIGWFQVGSNLDVITLLDENDYKRIKPKFSEVRAIIDPIACKDYKDCEVK